MQGGPTKINAALLERAGHSGPFDQTRLLGVEAPELDPPRADWLPVERLLSSVSPLSEINQLFDKLARGEAIRQIVVPDAPSG